MKNNLTVIDFFCGAGGFSEGFRQQGFDIVHGIDSWQPAIDTFNHNFGLQCDKQDILAFKDVNLIETLPDTDIIIGSPPCVHFSSSNKCGSADKTLGINLINIFLRIIAVKKYQPNSQLKAWVMENVSNSGKYVRDVYSFKDLGLEKWSKKHHLDSNQIAINLKNNSQVLNSADFGVAQIRKRLFAGEISKPPLFLKLKRTTDKENHISIRQIFNDFPHPFKNQKQIQDPNYKNLSLNKENLTDHFYDTGIYESHWDFSRYQKINHPYMGKMSFPENWDKPSRTITATKLANSREALIYESNLKRKGDGQYRTPTIREIAVLMSFPISYQFMGSENTKWRLIGNAVCPLVSGAIAKSILRILDRPIKSRLCITKKQNLKNVENLNHPLEKTFDNPPKRKKGCRFRRHPFKDGNMTVALSNYCLEENGLSDKKWRTTVTYGTGEKYKLQVINSRQHQKIKKFIMDNFDNGNEFIEEVHNGFSEQIAQGKDLQDMYEYNNDNGKLNPVTLIMKTKELVCCYANGETVDAGTIFKYKDKVHIRQLYALYAISRISLIANKRR